MHWEISAKPTATQRSGNLQLKGRKGCGAAVSGSSSERTTTTAALTRLPHRKIPACLRDLGLPGDSPRSRRHGSGGTCEHSANSEAFHKTYSGPMPVGLPDLLDFLADRWRRTNRQPRFQQLVQRTVKSGWTTSQPRRPVPSTRTGDQRRQLIQRGGAASSFGSCEAR